MMQVSTIVIYSSRNFMSPFNRLKICRVNTSTVVEILCPPSTRELSSERVGIYSSRNFMSPFNSLASFSCLASTVVEILCPPSTRSRRRQKSVSTVVEILCPPSTIKISLCGSVIYSSRNFMSPFNVVIAHHAVDLQ